MGRHLMAERTRLPYRRASLIFDLESGGLRYTASVSRFYDGRVAEVFLQDHKPGSQSDANARDSAVAASLALQFGCPLRVLQRAILRDPTGRAFTPLGVALDVIAELESEWPAELVAEVAAAPCRRVAAALIGCNQDALDSLPDHKREALLTELQDVIAELPDDTDTLAELPQRSCESPRGG